ncbi:MAG: SMP-30/gluconolactonase/LRE family protein [Defluviitaleaceae bacterium]|nr:SMP-30/gluconolactonase/LRE family protein [Defluviitaleaceae bacterium]
MNSNINNLPKLYPTQDTIHIPESHANLQTIIAEPWYEVSKDALQLEGLCFDRTGKNLFFCEVFGGTVFKLALPEKKLSTIQEPKGYSVGAVKLHKDGRVFICGMGDLTGKGGVFAVQPDGSNYETILDPGLDYCVDDLAFDKKGGFYFTDFKGGATFLDGGVYYVSPDYKTVTPIIQNLAIANGVAMAPDYKSIWATEVAGNRVFHVELLEDGVTIAPFGCAVMAHLTGGLGPDSCCVDEAGNLYIAMYNQGRILVLNRYGFPIGQIRLPESIHGQMLRSTAIAFVPESDQVIICSNDGPGGKGSWLYTARGFAQYHKTYQYL